MASLYFDEQEAVEELQKRGYRVVRVDFPHTASLNNVKDLIDYFYAKRLYYNADRPFPKSRNLQEDRKYINTLVTKRQGTGLSRKNAVKEAGLLIDTLFKFEEYLRLKEPVTSPRILTIGFIMDRVCAIANNEVGEVGEVATGQYVNEINEVYNAEFSERDSQRAAKIRADILERLHGKSTERD